MAALALGDKGHFDGGRQAYEVVEASASVSRPVLPATLTPLAVTPVVQATPRPGEPTSPPLPMATAAPAVEPQSADWLPLAGIGLGAAVFAGLGFVLLAASRKQKQG